MSRSAIKPKIGAYLSDDVTARPGMAAKRFGTPKLKFVNDRGMAQAGRSYVEILRQYYGASHLRKLY